GSWSPCGFSMVSTLGDPGGRGTTLAACGAFVPGALAGGVLTFLSLSALGALLGGGDVALLAGAALAAAAALAEATGRRIVPQIRRQVPEHWRRALPLPLAAAGYGVLLGLGFTTFVLTFAVPALAGVALAVGDPAAGLAIGLAFGAGRALPVVVLAPLAAAPTGIRATELMAERPAILRGFRAADAAALAAVALALGAEGAAAATPTAASRPSAARADATPASAPATAASHPSAARAAATPTAFVANAADPSAAGADLAWKVPGGPGVVRSPAGELAVPAEHIAIGGPYVATLAGGEVRVADRATGAEVARIAAPGADEVAVSATWLLTRTPGDRIDAHPLPQGGPARVVATGAATTLGRPALDGDRAVFHVTGRTASRIVQVDLPTGAQRTLRRATRAALTNPSLLGADLLFVRTTQWSQSLVLNRRALLRIAPAIRADRGYSTAHGPHRRVRRPRRPRREGPPGTTTTLWTTALAPGAAYVTRLRQRAGATTADLLRLPR
ncbi:MAG TPA: hypothetical protein VGW75_11600, partial [Solirubrobacteraceae bacterium]|nr:hypothetical protein [Solirubrobacteraceae bacterium]